MTVSRKPAKSDSTSGRHRLASAVAGASMGALSLLGASFARASITITRQSGTRTTSWTEIQTTIGSAIYIDDATLTNTAGTLLRDDAFDEALSIYLGPASDTSSGAREAALIDSVNIADNSPNGGSVSGTASATVNGIDLGVDWSLVFSSTEARVDGTFVVTNNGASTFDGYVAIQSDFGSDDETVIEATSSGDTLFDDTDTWVVTSENSGEAADDDPIVVSATTRSDAIVGPESDINPADGDDDELIWRIPVVLAPGESTTVGASHCLFETISEAIAGAPSCGSARSAEAVPAMHNPALLALAVMTGLLGTGQLLRRRKSVELS
jgi:hypothetical protein